MVAKQVKATDAKYDFEKEIPLFTLRGMSINQAIGRCNSFGCDYGYP